MILSPFIGVEIMGFYYVWCKKTGNKLMLENAESHVLSHN